MRASFRVAWRVAAAVAFAATAALAVTLTRGAPLHAALTSARHTGSDPTHADTSTPQCAASTLDISIAVAAVRSRVPHNVLALGTTQLPLNFTNVSGTACAISGYPEVAAYRAGHAQVGNAASLDASVSVRSIVLAPGATAHFAVVDSASAGRCRPVAAMGLRVVPPGESVPLFLTHAMPACSAVGRAAPVFLRVRAVQSGAGLASRTWDRPVSRPHGHRGNHL